MWTEIRYLFLRFLRDVNGIPEGSKAPVWMMIIHYILFPLNWAYERQARIKYNILYDMYTIRGIQITGEVFEMFKSEVGGRFEIATTKDGIVTIRRATEIQLLIHEN